MSTNKVLQGFFWFAFAAFLCASIPHVAYFFRSYEPDAPGQDTLWWVVSFALAISIDVTIFLLSVTVANLQRQKKSAGLIGSVWVFIAGLALLSWYINYKYAAHFINTGMISRTAIAVPWLGTIPDINPIIASAFQVLAIAYTWIADKIATDAPALTASQLKEKADELENAAREKARIAEIKRTSRTQAIKGLIHDTKDVIKTARDVTVKSDETQQKTEPEHNTITEPDTIPDATLFTEETQGDNEQEHNTITGAKTEQDARVKSDETQGDSAGINEPDATKNTVLDGSTSQRSVTIKEAALLLNLSESRVRTLVNNRKLRTSPRNSKKVLMSSITAYNNARKTEPITDALTEPITDVLPALKLVEKNEQNTEQDAGIEVEMSA